VTMRDDQLNLKLITYEEAVEQANSNPDEVEKSWVLHDFKNSPEIQAALDEAIQEKLLAMGRSREFVDEVQWWRQKLREQKA
jgi:hypothetical protein